MIKNLMDEAQAREIIKSLPKFDKDYAYNMGKDCAINGANLTNCNFAIFSSPENTKVWEQGKRDYSPTSQS
jgi:hypothetical protein